MKTRHLLIALSCTAVALASARAQLIQNGGFETGDFVSWDVGGTVQTETGSPGSNFVYSGDYGATLGSGYLSQAFVTNPGKTYRVEFLLNEIPGGSVGLLEVTWGNFDIPNNLDLGHVTLLHSFADPDPIPDTGWHKYTYDVLALGNVSSLAFEFQTQAVTYPNNAGLDGVKVAALPGFVGLPNLSGVPIGDPSPVLSFGRPYVLSSSVTFVPVPEPSTYGAFAVLALIGLVVHRRLRSAAAAKT